MAVFKKFNRSVERILKNGGVGIVLTDTIYGIVGSALNKKAVEKIYRLRKRNPQKPMIVLISSLNDLNLFGIKSGIQTKNLLKKFWPGKVSIILPIGDKRFVSRLAYLHRGSKSLALRLPVKKSLLLLLKKTGPLVAPSANLEGKPPANNIKEAEKYFGNKVDFYVDNGKVKRKSSKLIKIKMNKISVLRK